MLKKLTDLRQINRFALLLFTTPNCRPCKNISMQIDEISNVHGDKLDFYVCQIEENQHLVDRFKIKSAPSVLFLDNGVVKDRFAGYRDAFEIESRIMKLLFDLDSEIEF